MSMTSVDAGGKGVAAGGASRLGTVVVVLGGLALLGYGLYLSAWFINTLVLTLLLALAVSPVLLGLRNRGWPPWAAVVGGFLVVAGITLAFIALALVSLSQFDENLPSYQQRLTEIGNSIAARFNLTNPPVYDLSNVSPQLGQQIVQFLVPLAFNIVGLVAALVLYFFLLLYAFGEVFVMPARLRHLTGGNPIQLERLRRFGEDMKSFFMLNAGMGAIAAAIDTVVLLVIGVDFALLWGLLSFLLSFIPNIGFMMSMIPPALMALIQFGWREAALVIVAYCVINMVVDYVLRPRIIGKDLNMSQIVTFLSVVVWGALLGPTGALLAVPLTLISKLILEMATGSTQMSALIVEELPADPDAEPSVIVEDAAAPTVASPLPAAEAGREQPRVTP
jgi:predicted PurR-regulated permease PerM